MQGGGAAGDGDRVAGSAERGEPALTLGTNPPRELIQPERAAAMTLASSSSPINGW